MRGKPAATGLELRRKSTLSVAIMLALGGAQTVYAQDESQEAAGAQEVVVTTGTRLRSTGMDLPPAFRLRSSSTSSSAYNRSFQACS